MPKKPLVKTQNVRLTTCFMLNCLQNWNKMARLENGTYDEIVAHNEGELELNALEESDDLPIATMVSASTTSRKLLSNGFDTNKEAQCSYCKTTGHFSKNCRNWRRKRKWRTKVAKKHNSKHTHQIKLAGKKSHTWEMLARRWSSPTSQEDPTRWKSQQWLKRWRKIQNFQ